VKHLVDIDDALLEQARSSLGTATIKATVEGALRIAGKQKQTELQEAMERLAGILRESPPFDRSDAWR
jgi:Arc/MetJ family transcription regulator